MLTALVAYWWVNSTIYHTGEKVFISHKYKFTDQSFCSAVFMIDVEWYSCVCAIEGSSFCCVIMKSCDWVFGGYCCQCCKY